MVDLVKQVSLKYLKDMENVTKESPDYYERHKLAIAYMELLDNIERREKERELFELKMKKFDECNYI